MADEKILKSEELTDEQLDNVAGGTQAEIDKDANLMRTLGVWTGGDMSKDDVRRSWAKLGVATIFRDGKGYGQTDGPNEYYIKGKQVERYDALLYALKRTHSKIELALFR